MSLSFPLLKNYFGNPSTIQIAHNDVFHEQSDAGRNHKEQRNMSISRKIILESTRDSLNSQGENLVSTKEIEKKNSSEILLIKF